MSDAPNYSNYSTILASVKKFTKDNNEDTYNSLTTCQKMIIASLTFNDDITTYFIIPPDLRAEYMRKMLYNYCLENGIMFSMYDRDFYEEHILPELIKLSHEDYTNDMFSEMIYSIESDTMNHNKYLFSLIKQSRDMVYDIVENYTEQYVYIDERFFQGTEGELLIDMIFEYLALNRCANYDYVFEMIDKYHENIISCDYMIKYMTKKNHHHFTKHVKSEVFSTYADKSFKNNLELVLDAPINLISISTMTDIARNNKELYYKIISKHSSNSNAYKKLYDDNVIDAFYSTMTHNEKEYKYIYNYMTLWNILNMKRYIKRSVKFSLFSIM